MFTKLFQKNMVQCVWSFCLIALLLVVPGCYGPKETAQQDKQVQLAQTAAQPQVIPASITCGKCGMYPAKYPQWQTQVVFKDGSMTPFDGCKCLFGFLLNMSQYDNAHSTDDVAVVWVKDFNSGEWLEAEGAYFVVGSSEMGPMGKELIPFGKKSEATRFQEKNGGTLVMYSAIDMEVLRPLMGGMKMKGSGHMM